MTGTDLYDEKTGQVYTQVSTPVQSMVPAWVSACNGRKHLENGHLRKEQGASSLLDMSYRRCALNGFEADTIEFLGLFLAEKLYTFLRNR
ncbi:unnamed protein product [Periconia digitata]|uniref:Uncharacterized protein n=1 Tax=Periconia digitata TaxID=1303443 RepID=A0A9W4UMZ7_9PLEO|nr:unnamed protein product [Periconia digitata]